MSQFAPLKDRLDRIIRILERMEIGLNLNPSLGLHPKSAITIMDAPQAMEAPTIAPNAAGEQSNAQNVQKRRGRPPARRD